MTQLMKEMGPVRIRLDFDCNDTQDNVVDLLEEIAPYSDTNTPQESNEESEQESNEDSEEEEEEEEEEGEEESDQESVESKESSRLPISLAQKVNPAPSDWIVLQSKVAQLETELSVTKRAAKRARIEEEAVSINPPTDEELAKRVHDLERERNKVMEELLLLKMDLRSAQDELSEKTKQFHTEEHNNSVELRRLQVELLQVCDAYIYRVEVTIGHFLTHFRGFL